MRKAIAISATAAAAALLSVVACKSDRPASTTSTTSAGMLSSEDAVNRLAARRCDREIDCNNVGAGKRYDDRGGCERDVVHTIQEELGPTRCSYGVREDRLDQCLETLRTADCANPLDTREIGACRTTSLCNVEPR